MKPLKMIYTIAINVAIMLVVFLGAEIGVQSEPSVAFAAYTDVQTGYMRVITDDTPFYPDRNSVKPLFYLPYTYYVRILEYGELTSHVEYAGGGAKIDGYVPTYKLFNDGLRVDEPYPEIDAVTAKTAVLYGDADLTNVLQYVFASRSLNFYGKYYSPQGNVLYYVGYNNKLGYVKEEDLVPFIIENHPNELTFIKKEEPEIVEQETESENTRNVTDLRILIIAVLGFAGIVALFVVLGRRPKPHPAASYYDENDYE